MYLLLIRQIFIVTKQEAMAGMRMKSGTDIVAVFRIRAQEGQFLNLVLYLT